MATDIAFALGILSLVGKRAPKGIIVFLTALAIFGEIKVDQITIGCN